MSKKSFPQCDLHIHSIFSDSDTDLESIFKQAQKKGLSCIAITDHDTVEGVISARIYSQKYNLKLVDGLELSAQHKDIEIHILGYFIDIENKRLRAELANIKEIRKERLLWMAAKLNSLGIAIDSQELMSSIGKTIPTRLHLGLYLLKKGKVKSLGEAFKKYLSPGKPAYRAGFKYSVKEAIQIIKNYGGLAFLAHPHMIPDQSWIEEFISLGLDGLEVIYPRMSLAKSSLYKNITLKFGLLKCGGSDAHGSYKEFTEIGGVTVPYGWVEEMRERLSLQDRRRVTSKNTNCYE